MAGLGGARWRSLGALVSLALTACSSGPDPAATPTAVSPGSADQTTSVAGVPLHPLPAKLREACRAAGEHAPILCPSLFPRRTVEPPSRVVTQQLPLGDGLYGIELGYSAPYEDAPRRNRPARFLHFVIIVQTGSTEYDVRSERLAAMTIGHRRGDLTFVTEESIHLDHVVFAWEERGVEYQASLHAWDDRNATVELLRALVASLRPSGRL